MFKFVKEQDDGTKCSTKEKRVIVLIGSLASQINIFGFVGYGASKFAIRGIWEGLTMECEPLNIRVISAFPPSTGRCDKDDCGVDDGGFFAIISVSHRHPYRNFLIDA